MKQPRNSIEAYLPVSNIGERQIRGLEESLSDGTRSDPEPKTLRRLFAPARNPRFKMLTAAEVANFHEAIGQEELDEARAKDLAHYLKRSLSDLFEDAVPILTPQAVSLEPLDNGFVLSVASSPAALEARRDMKAALAARYMVNMEGPAGEAFLDDRLATSLWIARSDGPATNGLIQQAHVELRSNDELFDYYMRVEDQDPVKVAASLR